MSTASACIDDATVALAYSVTRAPAAADGAPAPLVVLVHGMTSAGLTFANVTDAIARLAGVNVVAVDLRGHGASPDAPALAGGYRLRAMAADIVALLAALAADASLHAAGRRVHLLGHSWGSRVVATLAVHWPALVASVFVEDEYLVPVGPRAAEVDGAALPTLGPFELPADADDAAVGVAGVKKAAAGSAPAFEEWTEAAMDVEAAKMAALYQPHFPTYDDAIAFYNATTGPGVCDFSRKILERDVEVPAKAGDGATTTEKGFVVLFKPHVAHAWDFHCRASADAQRLWLDVRRFPFPVHVQKGGDDATSDVSPAMWARIEAEAAALAAAGGRRSVSIIPGAAHTVHRACPEAFTADLVAFLRATSSA